MVSLPYATAMAFTALALTTSACSSDGLTTRIGDTDICIPNHFMDDLGSSTNHDEYDEAPPIYEAMYIDPPYIQQEIPAYQGYIGDKILPLYKALHVTITDHHPYQGDPQKGVEYDHLFSKPNPNLVANPYESPFLDWAAYEIQPDLTREYWGYCFDFKPLDCTRDLQLEGLDFSYSVTGSNVDLYPAIDAYLTKKVTKEWRCESNI